MADGKVEFELVSPEKLLLSKDVDMVVVPGEEGRLRRFAAACAHALLRTSPVSSRSMKAVRWWTAFLWPGALRK